MTLVLKAVVGGFFIGFILWLSQTRWGVLAGLLLPGAKRNNGCAGVGCKTIHHYVVVALKACRRRAVDQHGAAVGRRRNGPEEQCPNLHCDTMTIG